MHAFYFYAFVVFLLIAAKILWQVSKPLLVAANDPEGRGWSLVRRGQYIKYTAEFLVFVSILLLLHRWFM